MCSRISLRTLRRSWSLTRFWITACLYLRGLLVWVQWRGREDVRLRCGIVVRVVGQHLGFKQAVAKIPVRLVVGDGTLLGLCTGRRFVLALHGALVVRCKRGNRQALLIFGFGAGSFGEEPSPQTTRGSTRGATDGTNVEFPRDIEPWPWSLDELSFSLRSGVLLLIKLPV